jgi:hypothetical protein
MSALKDQAAYFYTPSDVDAAIMSRPAARYGWAAWSPRDRSPNCPMA